MLMALVAAAVFDVLFGLSFPPVSVWPLALLSPVPLLWLAWSTKRPGWAGLGVFLGTLPLWLVHHWWLLDVTAMGTPVLMLIMAVYPALFVLIAARIRRRWQWPDWLVAGVLWTGLEFLRGEVIGYGYPWFMVAHPTIESGAARWLASQSGVYGVSLVVVLLSALLLSGAEAKRRWMCWGVRAVSFVGMLVVATALTSIPWMPPAEEDSIVVAVVQTNVPSSNKVDWMLEERIEFFEETVRATADVLEYEPDLVVWPETMFPGYSLSSDVGGLADAFPDSIFFLQMREALLRFQAELGIPMLVGSVAVDDPQYVDEEVRVAHTWNSVFLIEGGDAASRYDKMHLTPFGEVMPYISHFDWLEQALLSLGAPGMTFDLDAGTAPAHFDVRTRHDRTVRIVTPICFEATVSPVCRRLVTAPDPDASLIINVTNDGWFGDSDSGRRHHALLARWRAAELGVPVLRAANTGISQFIAPGGSHVPVEEPARTAGVMYARIPVAGERSTLYARTGNVVGISCALALLLLFPAALRRPPGRATQATPADGTMESDSKEPEQP